MMFRDTTLPVLQIIETVSVYLLFFDYVLRWMTYDHILKRHSPWAFVVYPLTPFAIMDILGILPSIGLLPASFMILRLLRLGKILQYSKSCRRIVNVFRNQGKTLLSVLIIAVAYIFISALVMFVYEPAENFPTFFDALYWATTALTTVGNGDIYPCTAVGRFISMISSLFGVAVIAMPAGIVTAGFMEELNKDMERYFYELALERGVPGILACFLGTAVLKLIDGVILAVIIPVLYKLTPKELVTRLVEDHVSWKNSFWRRDVAAPEDEAV